jgi:hypothetical protein|tara:strand:- start:7239 stop:7991 length:753 start_codon:yes stop_codon:yes gene_type:complete
MEKNNTPTWEFKDRTYVIKGANQPPLVSIQAKHSNKKPLLWFDQEKGYNRELRYATNQKSPFVDEQEGYATLGHIYFRNGSLTVPKEKQALQKLLSLYHPKKDSTYAELTPIKDAENEVDIIELQIEALNLAKGLDIEELEAILRVNYGNKVSKMSTKELKRDGLIYARNNPAAFIELASDDNVHLRNVGVKAVEQNIIKLSDDNRKFLWTNGRKLFTVPFEENPYSALAAWFKTDDGMEVLKSVEKKLK